jgi:hypothetical protein
MVMVEHPCCQNGMLLKLDSGLNRVQKADLGKIILKVISDQIKIIFSKKNLKSDQDLIFFK